MMRNIFFILLLISVSAKGQEPDFFKDTVHIFFDTNNPDSLCDVWYADVATIKKTSIKKYRKSVKRDRKGNVLEISFQICEEEFRFRRGKHITDTLSGATYNRMELVTIEEALNILHRTEKKLNENAKRDGVIYVYPNYRLINTFIIEEVEENKVVKCETTWVEKTE